MKSLYYCFNLAADIIIKYVNALHRTKSCLSLKFMFNQKLCLVSKGYQPIYLILNNMYV